MPFEQKYTVCNPVSTGGPQDGSIYPAICTRHGAMRLTTRPDDCTPRWGGRQSTNGSRIREEETKDEQRTITLHMKTTTGTPVPVQTNLFTSEVRTSSDLQSMQALHLHARFFKQRQRCTSDDVDDMRESTDRNELVAFLQGLSSSRQC